jgi:hypothetical protein
MTNKLKNFAVSEMEQEKVSRLLDTYLITVRVKNAVFRGGTLHTTGRLSRQRELGKSQSSCTG